MSARDRPEPRRTRPGHGQGGGERFDDGGLAPGSLVGDYQITRRIAEGGFGTVYQVEHVLLGRPAALKMLHAELVTTPEAFGRFEREARAVNLIRHPNIVDIFDFGTHVDGRPYFLMELLEGEDLFDHVSRLGARPPGEVVRLLEPIARALDAAHGKGVLHRDLKAPNVFLDTRHGARRVVLLDFGVAKIAGDARALTRQGEVVGTPTLMAPEQRAGLPLDGRTDLWALGALALHLLCGRPPVPGRAWPVPPAPVGPVLERALADDREQRYPTGEAFIRALEAAAG